MFCPKCGSSVADGARFCPKCGTQMPTRAPAVNGGAPYGNAPNPGPIPNPGPTPNPGPIPKSRSRWPMVVAIIVAAFIVVVGAGLYVVMPAVAGPNYVNPLDFTIDWIGISGDRATVRITEQIPDIQAIMSNIEANEDISDMSQQELYELFVQRVADPSIPTTTASGDSYLTKIDGEWVLTDENGTPITELLND